MKLSRNSPLALWDTTVSAQLIALEASTNTRSNTNSIAMTTVILALGQTAGSVYIVAVALTAITLIARLTKAILAVSGREKRE